MPQSAERQNHRPLEIFVDISPPPDSGDLAPRIAMPEEFRRRAGEVAESVADIADHFRDKLARIIESPDDSRVQVETIEIKFELALRAEAGVIIAKTSAGGTFSASLTLRARPEGR